MLKVKKRSGKLQAFNLPKLQKAIYRAAAEAKLVAEKRRELSKEVAEGVRSSFIGQKTVSAIEIRRRVLRRLDIRSRATSQAWRRYDKKRH